ncbi:MAG: Uncharacterized protein LiPW41_58 [Parcubacteria group bacterium LiPW_41]|nr:MAG: Uncharacterized protein LiPW41_58 [Parcubacteria group bacterium LiPW_41]
MRERVIALRKKGYSFLQINRALGSNIPKSTISFWLKGIELSNLQKQKLETKRVKDLKVARQKALEVKKEKRKKYLENLLNENKWVIGELNDKKTKKITLAMLYLAEGSKTKKGSITIGNSDPLIIKLFLNLLRSCYEVDESKFRCTLQCRDDQNIEKLEIFWSKLTNIPLSCFYKARVDPRSINKKSRKMNYKGVCRIDYFSANIFNEFLVIFEILRKNMGL